MTKMISVAYELKDACVFLNVEQFVALQIHLKTEEVELLVTRGLGGGGEDKGTENLPVVASDSAAASKDEMQSLEDNEPLSRLKVEHHLVVIIIIICFDKICSLYS